MDVCVCELVGVCVQVCAHTVCVCVCAWECVYCFPSHSLLLVAFFPNRSWKLCVQTSVRCNILIFLKFSFKIYSTASAWNCKRSLLVFSDSSVQTIRLLPILAGCFDSGLYGKEMCLSHHPLPLLIIVKSMKLCLKVMFHNQKIFLFSKGILMLIIPKIIVFSQKMCAVWLSFLKSYYL